MNVIKIEDLLYEVEGKILFEHGDIKIPNGKYHLVGNNGVGKTTLFNLISSNLKPNAGTVVCEHKVMYVNQFPQLLEDARIKHNINFFNNQNKREIIDILEESNIDVNKKVKSLSGGQKQFVYLLICLISDYGLYLIDEPFNNLDKDKVSLITRLINERTNVIVIDHKNSFDYPKLKIEKRGLLCDI